jgi:hypothetical protein
MLDWQGRQVQARVIKAAKEGIDATMAAAAIHAKQHHPWTFRTGTLEGSIAIAEYAHEEGGLIVGLWGSLDVVYAKWLELGTGRMAAYPYLRPAADVEYPKLAERIQRGLA